MGIVGVVSLYWAVSISLVFVNKALLKGDELQLDAPLFVTFYQCVCTVLLCKLCDRMAQKYPDRMSFPSCSTSKMTLNNLCLQEVGVAFYTIARSLVTIFSIVFTFMILGKRTMSAILCCAIIIAGFCLGVDQEGDLGSLSVKGTIYGVVASACVALNAIYRKFENFIFSSLWIFEVHS